VNSFADLWEMVCREGEEDEPLQQDVGDSKAITVLVKQEPEFWEKFAQLARADPESLAGLLGVDEGDVITWYGKIKEAQDAAARAKAENDKDTMIPTGQI